MNNLNIKKINKILAVTLLMFGSIVLADYSKSASRYYKDKEAISFDTNLISLYHTNASGGYDFSILGVPNSTATKIAYKYIYERNKPAYTEQELAANVPEQYTITVDEGCTISSVSAYNRSETLPSDIANNYTITFNGAPGEHDEVTIEYSCPVNLGNSSDITTGVEVREKISGDKSDFLYLIYNNSITKEYYKNEILHLEEPKIEYDYNKMIVPKTIAAADIKDGARTWFNTYFIPEYRTNNASVADLANIVIQPGPLSAHTTDYDNPLEKYLYDALGDFTDLNVTLPLGLTITDSADGNSYVFEIDDKYVGYALTDWHYGNPNKVFYFTNVPKDQTKTEEIFNYYVHKYMSDKETEVQAYFTSIGGIYDYVTGTTSVSPLIMMYNGGRLLFQSHFLKPIYEVDFGQVGSNPTLEERRSYLKDTIYNGLVANWPGEYCSTTDTSQECSVFRETIGRRFTTNVFMTNASSVLREGTEFHDYLVYHTETRDILISIYNENDNGTVKTYAMVEELPSGFTYPDATTIAYLTPTDGLTNAQIVTNIQGYSTRLDALLGTNYTDSITESLIGTTSYPNGIHRLSNPSTAMYHTVVIFVNNMDGTYNNTQVGHVPDAGPSGASIASVEEEEEVQGEQTEPSQNDTPAQSEQTSQGTPQVDKKDNDDGDTSEGNDPEPTGDGGEE